MKGTDVPGTENSMCKGPEAVLTLETSGGGGAEVLPWRGTQEGVLGVPASPSDMGLTWQGSSERLWPWGWAQELCLARAHVSLSHP